jgi:hypothetical protein
MDLSEGLWAGRISHTLVFTIKMQILEILCFKILDSKFAFKSIKLDILDLPFNQQVMRIQPLS